MLPADTRNVFRALKSCINEEILPDFQEIGPEADAGGRFLDCGHFESSVYRSVPDTADSKHGYLVEVSNA